MRGLAYCRLRAKDPRALSRQRDLPASPPGRRDRLGDGDCAGRRGWRPKLVQERASLCGVARPCASDQAAVAPHYSASINVETDLDILLTTELAPRWDAFETSRIQKPTIKENAEDGETVTPSLPEPGSGPARSRPMPWRRLGGSARKSIVALGFNQSSRVRKPDTCQQL